MSEETWVLMSTRVLAGIDIGIADLEHLMGTVIHATPDEMEVDPNIHRHLNEGGMVIIHCEVD